MKTLISTVALSAFLTCSLATLVKAEHQEDHQAEHKADAAKHDALVLGTKIHDHVVEDQKTHFHASDEAVIAQITLMPSVAGQVTFHWKKDGKEVHTFAIDVKDSPRYRVHASKKISNGNWAVDVKDKDGKVLGEQTFTVGDVIVNQHDDNQGEKVIETKPAEAPVVEEKKAEEVKVETKAAAPVVEEKKTEEVKVETVTGPQTSEMKAPVEAATKPVEAKKEENVVNSQAEKPAIDAPTPAAPAAETVEVAAKKESAPDAVKVELPNASAEAQAPKA